ncbi:tyrosine-type recombinase/integrase [Acinetobacter ursingii]|uniref:tyrosine-type recombinase/integrase n=1 Tax=Acinetobacter ursingii TaxID=108980 RepID=UPI0012505733|nr:tyrosine-type recombinase/integrase [Acinetobacter ursingii]
MLKDTQVKNLKPEDKPYRKLDADRLYIEVRPSGKKVWIHKFSLNKKEGSITYGEYPSITIAEARAYHARDRALLAKGINPVIYRNETIRLAEEAQEETFKKYGDEWKEKHKLDKSADYKKLIEYGLKTDIYPVIGHLHPRNVTSQHVLLIMNNTMERIRTSTRSQKLKPSTGETTAIVNKTFIGMIMRTCIMKGLADVDPTYAVKGIIKRPKINHARPLSMLEIREFKEKIPFYSGAETTKNALNFLFYTMLRTIEVRRLEWSWIDWDNKTITFPERTFQEIIDGKRVMKNNKIHLLPLSSQAFAILEEQYTITSKCQFVFSSPMQLAMGKPEKMLGRSTLNFALDALKLKDVSPHDARATASTYLNELGSDERWIEKQLSHSDKDKTRATYNHAKWLQKRRAMLQWYADFLDGEVEMPVHYDEP